MKKIILLFALFSCEKEKVPTINCYNCSAGVTVNHVKTAKYWRECGASAELIENYHNRPYINGNGIQSKCFLESK